MLLFCLLAPLAHAAPCGTAVIPSGIGVTDPSSVTSLNPLLGPSVPNLQTTLLLFRPLVWIGADDQQDTARSLAASITAFDANRRIRVALKPRHWSDGTQITADDILFTWERIKLLGEIFAYGGQGGVPDHISEVRAIDPLTVDFILNRATNPAWFALNGLSQFPPLPRHAWGNPTRNDMWRRQTDPAIANVVDGPFKLQTLRLDRFASFVPNATYEGTPAHLARLVVDFQEGQSPLRALRAGSLDMAQISPALWQASRTLPGFQPITQPEPFGYLALNFNFHNGNVAFLQDPAVRRALTMATDQATIITLVYHGLSHENRAPVPVIPPAWLSPALRAGHAALAYNPTAAAALLQTAGYIPGPDGIRARAGHRLAFTTLASAETPERGPLLQIMQQNLRAIGVDLHIRLLSQHQLDATLGDPTGTWEAALLGEQQSGMPDGNGVFDTGGAGNTESYSDPVMDRLVHASVDQPGLDGLFAYEDYAAAQQPVNVVPQAELPLLVANRIGGAEKFVNPQAFWAPEELWVRDGICPAPPTDHTLP